MTLPDFLAQDKYGYIHLTGHRIGLRHVVDLYHEGYTPEMLVDHFPTLSLALIHKILGFYLENQAEVDAYIARCRQEIERQAAAPPQGPDLNDPARYPLRGSVVRYEQPTAPVAEADWESLQ
jgi:uncharacterized protein (DUF433 family)